MPRNDGKDAEAGFLSIMTRLGAVVERFWDQADLRGRNGGRPVGDFPKPSDFLVTLNGLLHYAEVKSTVSTTSFSFHSIQKGQSSAALRQARVHGPYNFYIYSFHLAQWFLMPCKQYAETLDAGRASIKFEELTPWNPFSLT